MVGPWGALSTTVSPGTEVGKKEHLISVVNWTKEDESLGRGKGWAEAE